MTYGAWEESRRAARSLMRLMSTYTSEPGTRLGGRYRLEDRVAGAAGWSAWKAIDETLARAVTVFTLAPGFPRIREVVTAARAASRLNDSRLTQVFDVEDDWDRAYIVMEWPAGETLDDLLAAGPIDPGRGARIVAEAAGALSVAHAAGLAHLCLNPESLRWTAGGGVKVIGPGHRRGARGNHRGGPGAGRHPRARQAAVCRADRALARPRLPDAAVRPDRRWPAAQPEAGAGRRAYRARRGHLPGAHAARQEQRPRTDHARAAG